MEGVACCVGRVCFWSCQLAPFCFAPFSAGYQQFFLFRIFFPRCGCLLLAPKGFFCCNTGLFALLVQG